MRDDTARWAPPRAEGLDAQMGTLRVRHMTGLRQTLVSGAGVLTRFKAEAGPAVGWPDPAAGNSYAVALRRDRVLLVDGPDLSSGWDTAAQLAVSDATDTFLAFEISGADWPDLLARGTEMGPSRSAVRRFGGMEVALYAHEAAIRVHIERARAEQFVTWVERMAQE